MGSVRGHAGLLFGVLAALLVVPDAAAAHKPKPVPGQTAALTAVKKAVASGRLDRATAAADRAEIARAAHLVRVLPTGRGVHVQVALEQVGALAGYLTKPRAVAVFGQLRANDDYFSAHWAPPGGTDITGSDGVVYRYFVGLCFEFHPLANFAELNAHVAAKSPALTQQLADALVARGVSLHGGGIGWEYYFRFGGGRPPWVSGMAQAVAAQAFARAASLVPDESSALLGEAHAAFAAIPGKLTTKVAAGPWIRLYSFSKVAVLNAQLQSVVSLESYAGATSDGQAATLAAQMQRAAAATLPRFDTGYWSYYSLAGDPSPLSYHKFVVQLLRKLSSADGRFADAAARFALYLKQPPAFKLGTAQPGALRFWVSKPASVTVTMAAGSARRLSLGAGWHTLSWREPKHAGIYGIKLTALGPAGHSASFTALPIVRVTSAPRHAAANARTTAGSGAATGTPPAFAAGVGIDTPAQSAQARALGFRLVRMTLSWQPGEAALSPGLVAALRSLPAGTGLVVDLSAAQLPSDDAGRAVLGRFAASLAQQAPTLSDLVLTPAPTQASAQGYADSVAALVSAVKAVEPTVAVGPSIDGSVPKPRQATLALGRRLAHDGAKPGLVAFRPAASPSSTTWDAGEVGSLESALAKSLGSAPPVLLDAVATPTIVPPSELGAYTGGPPPTQGAVPPPTQATTYAGAVRSASCSANVIGVVLDRLVDLGAVPEPATGLYYASGHAKPSAAAVKQAVSAARRGAVVCPGVGARVTPTTLTFPQQLDSSSPPSVTLGCSRDCLYLVTLERADGRPVLATRGTLSGGAAPATIALPKQKLSRGSYRLDVRLVSRVNPSVVTRRTSPPLTLG